MLFSSIFLLASVSLSAFAAPIPHRREVTGWPRTTGKGKGKAGFGISGNFKDSFLDTKEGQPTLVASYPKGSYAGANIAGFIFHADGDVGIENAKEAVVTYQLKFPDGFDFALAGKLPGLYGGDNPDTAGKCAGGNHNDDCWSARLMWREQGKGELYGYLPTANKQLPICEGAGCDNKYGASIGTGKWKWTPGKWHTVQERIKLNDVGENNGEVEVTVDGESYINEKGVQWRSKSAGRIRGIMMHTFFGGSSKPDYASPKEQEAYFRNFELKVTEKL